MIHKKKLIGSQEEQDPEVEQGVYANLANAFNIEDREDEQETETTSA